MHKAQRGQKLSVVRKVVTPLNFVTPSSFSVTPPSCKPLTALSLYSILLIKYYIRPWLRAIYATLHALTK